jgi:putative aldouronate transport system substrate-binding protein
MKRKASTQVGLISVAAALAAVSVLAGCGSEEKSVSSSSAAPGASVPAQSAPAKKVEPTKIKIMTQMSNEAPNDDNPVKLELEKLTNTKLDITWVPSTAYNDKFNATLASSELPHVLLVSSNRSANVVNAVRAGAFWEIGPYLKQFPNLSKLNPEVLNGAGYDGKIYLLPRSRDAARHVVAYRKDWLKNLGLSEPKTLDDFYNVAKAFTEKDPDKNGKHDTVGYVETSSLDSLTRDVSVYFGAPFTYGLVNNQVTPNFLTPAYMEALQFYKKMYADKFMNQDFALINVTQMKDMLVKGKAGMAITVDSDLSAAYKDTKKIDPHADFGFVQGLTGPKGLLASSTGGFLGGYMFSKGAVKTEAELLKILAFFDKISTPEGMTLLYRGVKDADYTVEGQYAIPNDSRPDTVKRANSALNQLAVAHVSVAMPLKLADVDATIAGLVAENEKIAIYNISRAMISKTQTEKGPELDKMIKDAQVKFIMNQLDDAGFKKAVEDWRKAGGDKVIAEFTEEYNKAAK